jgi:hypothetical protein
MKLNLSETLWFAGLDIHKLDNRHCRSISRPITEVQYASIPPVSGGETGCYFIEEFADHSIATYHLQHLATRMEISAFSQGYQLVGNATELFGLRFGSDNSTVLQ